MEVYLDLYDILALAIVISPFVMITVLMLVVLVKKLIPRKSEVVFIEDYKKRKLE